MKIFLVDDNPIALAMLSTALDDAGYETTTADNGIEALKLIPVERPDIIILDVMMPKMDGFETARRLRANPETARIPILLLTARDQIEDRIAGFDSGADDYVTKPVTTAELIARVRALIRRSGIYAQIEQSPRGRMLAFLGVKGGVGTTTLAVNAALACAQDKHRVVLVDLHPWAGAVAAQLGIMPQASLATLAEKGISGITQQLLANCFYQHTSGVQVLAATHQLANQSSQLVREQVIRIIEHLESMGGIVILDAGNGLTPTALEIVKNSRVTAIVTAPDPVSLTLTSHILQQLRQMGLDDGRLGLVLVNRSPAAPALTDDQIEKELGSKLVSAFAYSPEIYAGAPVLLGQPDTDAAEQMRQLANKMMMD